MKKIKRTTIKIRQRELIVVSRRETSGAETIEICPTCHFPVTDQRSLAAEEKTPPLLKSNEDYNK